MPNSCRMIPDRSFQLSSGRQILSVNLEAVAEVFTKLLIALFFEVSRQIVRLGSRTLENCLSINNSKSVIYLLIRFYIFSTF